MSDFNGLRKTLRHTQKLNGTLKQVFPLLCPVREYDWIDDWECDLIHSDSGLAELDCVFSTQTSGTRLGDVSEEIWTISRYEPNSRIEFVKFAAGLYLVRYEIILDTIGETHASAKWSQYFTGLSEAGNRIVTASQQSDFSAAIMAMEGKLNYYLKHGTCQKG